MAYYDGEYIFWDVAVLGILWLLALQAGTSFLRRYFDLRYGLIPQEPAHEDNSNLTASSILFIAYGFLAGVASLTVLFFRVVRDPSIYLIMGLLVVGALWNAIPSLRQGNSGFGELILSLIIVNLTPALGYKLLGGNTLRLLAMVTFPLTALHLAMLLVFSLSTYAADLKYTRRTMMVRMGWQNGMLVHNLLVLFAYLLLIIAITIGLPWKIGSPALLTLPVGLYQIWSINRIAGGGKPQWKSLTLVSAALFVITAYLLTFSFWIR
jgi:1,4-dihydroxy-2-naphthoate octaprenyltransferase